MASVSTTKKNGRRRVLFFDVEGKRQGLHLGLVNLNSAREVGRHVDALVRAKKYGTDVSDRTASWLRDVDDELRARLAELKVIEPVSASLLGPYANEYRQKRISSIAASTANTERLTVESLVEFFGANKPLREITVADAKDFRNFLLDRGGKERKNTKTGKVARKPLDEATTRKRCSVACTIFQDALERGLITKNPFKSKAIPRSNIETQRIHEISTDDALAVLAELPGTQLKLLFALSRWAGMRVGSEVRRLTWADILWDQKAIRVTNVKTRRKTGKPTRMCPMFEELVPLLNDRFAEADEGETLVLPMLAGRTDASLRKPLEAAIKRAGLTTWPRLWHNMRATRQTELAAKRPLADVCAWLGNSLAIAAKHYVRPSDRHFAEATQNTTQTRSDTACQEPPAETAKREILGKCDTYSICVGYPVLPVGLEPTTY